MPRVAKRFDFTQWRHWRALFREARLFCAQTVHPKTLARCFESAAALTFTTLLSIVPMFTVLYAILALVPSLRESGVQLENWLFQHFIPTSGEEIQVYLQEFSLQASKLTKFGLLFLFVTAIMMMKRIEKSLNAIWQVPEPRKGVIGFMRYWSVLSLGPILVGLGLGMTSYLASLSTLNDAVVLLGVQKMGLSLLPFLLSWLAFAMVYIIVPNCEVPLKSGLKGGFLAAVVFELAKRGFTLFVANFGSYKAVYGAFAALPLFLIWLYLSWVIVLMGAVLTHGITVYRHSEKRTDPLIGVLSVLYLFWTQQQQGKSVSDQAVLKAFPHLSPDQWQAAREKLRAAALIERNDQGSYLLSRRLEQVSLLSLLNICGFYYDYQPSLRELKSDQPDWQQALTARLSAVIATNQTELSLSLAALFSPLSQQADARDAFPINPGPQKPKLDEEP